MPKYISIKSQNSALQPYIEEYVYCDLSNEPVLSKDFLPKTGMIWAMVNEPVGSGENHAYDNFLIGIQTRALPLKPKAQEAGFFVKFSPYGMSRFMDIPLHRFSNKIIESSTIWGGDIDSLHNQVMDSKSISKKISILESFLLNRLAEPDPIENAIFRLAGDLKYAESSFSLLKKKVPLSSRQLERKFKSLIGVNIQTFKRICRFQQAFELLHPDKVNLTHIGYESGYYDQAHFSNDFKKFTKFRPKTFFQEAPFYNLLYKTATV